MLKDIFTKIDIGEVTTAVENDEPVGFCLQCGHVKCGCEEKAL